MNKHNQQNQNISGLIVAGTVTDRVRRHVPKKNPTTEIVTYTIVDSDNHKYFVDDYAPESYYDLDKYVRIPIYIKSYIKKNGEPSFNFNVQKRNDDRGEHF